MKWRKTVAFSWYILFTMLSNAVQSQFDGSTKHLIPHEIPENSDHFGHLWATIDSVQRGEKSELSILYIGGSHVQAGWIGHFMREKLSLWMPEARWSRGLMLPYRLAQKNTPTHFRTEMSGSWSGQSCANRSWTSNGCDLGSGTGIQVQTNSGLASIQHVAFLPDSTLMMANSFDIWTNANRNEISFGSTRGKAQMTALESGTGWRLALQSPVDTFRLNFVADENRSTPLVYEGVYAQLDASTQIVVNEWGHNGLHVKDFRNCRELKTLVRRMKPDLVIIGIGLNDAMNETGFKLEQFAQDYSWTVNALQEVLPKTAFLLLSNTPVNEARPFISKHSFQIQTFLQAYSKSAQCGFFDLHEAIGGSEGMDEWVAQGWMKADGIHFHSFGYEQIACHIFAGIKQAFLNEKNARNSEER
jgi:lysophospholipase L1-like esterase